MKIQSITKQLKKFENQIRKSKSPILFQHTEETLLEEKHILSFIDNQKNVVYMRLPKGEKTYIGFEKTIKHEVNSKEEFINLKNITYHLKNNGLNNDVLLFGAASFNMDKKNSSPWNNIPRGYFFIPSILFTYTNEKSYLTISLSLKNNFSIKETEDKIKNYLDLIQKQFETKNNKKLNLLDKKLLPSKDSYLETLSNIKRKIDRGELNKIVISRIERYFCIKN